MPRLILLLITLLLSGCSYNFVCNGAGSVDKPVDVGTSLQGNIPLQGGAVNNPVQNSQ